MHTAAKILKKRYLSRGLIYLLTWCLVLNTSLPLALGFGISRKEQVDALANSVDAVVVGSALVDVIANASPDERISKVKAFMQGLGATSQ